MNILKRCWTWIKNHFTEGSAAIVVTEGIIHSVALGGSADAALIIGAPWLALGLICLAVVEIVPPAYLAWQAMRANRASA